jgi:hypothetical protein
MQMDDFAWTVVILTCPSLLHPCATLYWRDGSEAEHHLARAGPWFQISLQCIRIISIFNRGSPLFCSVSALQLLQSYNAEDLRCVIKDTLLGQRHLSRACTTKYWCSLFSLCFPFASPIMNLRRLASMYFLEMRLIIVGLSGSK